MENFIVSARKYRPSSFKDVVGQSALTNTLKQAITRNKLASAYLFCGPRGVGKTTCARIFAKAINCMDPMSDGEACNECESCRSFNEQRSMNIQELNAAANNSVEDIRAIIEQVRIPPQLGKYKVIILDEVHMLSQSAANALLKTLEEPPSYVIFILATTEKHKILSTILSRCQIFDFNRMEIENIIDELKMVASKEGITYEENALNMIAQKADGGMRDALSIFDQVTNFSAGNITYESVLRCLNYLDYDYYFQMTEHLLNHNVNGALLLLGEIISKGFDAGIFIGGLAGHLRNLLVSRDACTLPLLDVAASVKDKYSQQALQASLNFLYKAIKLCDQCSNAYKASFNKRLSVEIALIETAQLETETFAETQGAAALKPVNKMVAQTAPAQVQTVEKGTKATPMQKPVIQHTESPKPINNIKGEVSRPKVISTPRISIGRAKKETVISETQTASGGTATDEANPPAEKVNEPAAALDLLVDEKALQFYWNNFAQNANSKDVALAARLKNAEVSLQGENDVIVNVPNEMAKIVISESHNAIETYLRNELKNSHLHLAINVKITENQILRSNPQQLLEKMIADNPNLGKLKNDLYLELD